MLFRSASISEITLSLGRLNDRPPYLAPVPRRNIARLLMLLLSVVGSVSYLVSYITPSRLPLLSSVTMLAPVQHRRTKHIEIDIHFVREKVSLGEIRVLHVPSSHQYADIMTKGLPSQLFIEFRSSLCLLPYDAQAEGGC